METENQTQQGPSMDRAVLGTILGTIRLALADRSLTWVGLLAAIGFGAWAMANPTEFRLGCAAGYAVLVFWPILYKQRG